MTQAADKSAIRSFHVAIPDAELTELRRRIEATRWPERETVSDFSQGVPQATIGGHFAAWEQPQLLSTELRTAFKSLR